MRQGGEKIAHLTDAMEESVAKLCRLRHERVLTTAAIRREIENFNRIERQLADVRAANEEDPCCSES